MKDDQNFWNFWLLVFSVILLVAELWALAEFGTLPTSVGLFDAALIALASFRLTRLFVYDSIMYFVRDWFLKRTVVYTADEVVIHRQKYPSGFRRAMSDLFSCPWCMGLQVAMVVVFFYYLTSFAWIVIFMFAVGGIATFVQLAANAVGWRAEYFKRKTETEYSEPAVKGGSGGTCG